MNLCGLCKGEKEPFLNPLSSTSGRRGGRTRSEMAAEAAVQRAGPLSGLTRPVFSLEPCFLICSMGPLGNLDGAFRVGMGRWGRGGGQMAAPPARQPGSSCREDAHRARSSHPCPSQHRSCTAQTYSSWLGTAALAPGRRDGHGWGRGGLFPKSVPACILSQVQGWGWGSARLDGW